MSGQRRVLFLNTAVAWLCLWLRETLQVETQEREAGINKSKS